MKNIVIENPTLMVCLIDADINGIAQYKFVLTSKYQRIIHP